MKTKIFFILLFLVSVLVVSCANQKEVASAPAGKESAVQKSTEQLKTELTGILGNKIKSYKATYSVSASEGGSTSVNTITMAFKGSSIRYDTSGISGGQEITSSVFIIDNKAYICTEKPQKMCIMTDSGEAKQSSLTGEETIEENINSYDLQMLASMTIAGAQAKCYRISAGSSSSDICYSKEGVMLYLKTSNAEMTATDYSTNVPDSYFVLPAQPQSMPAYNAGIVPA